VGRHRNPGEIGERRHDRDRARFDRGDEGRQMTPRIGKEDVGDEGDRTGRSLDVEKDRRGFTGHAAS